MTKSMNSISQFNYSRDKNVVGKQWASTYKGWFGSIQIMDHFIKKVEPYLRVKKELEILYVCSASGMLGERLVEKLQQKGIQANLTIADISKEHLALNKNPNTKKIRGDILKIKLKKKFDVVLMRSSLHYFPTDKIQIQVLKKIKKLLNKNGIFLNQPALMPSIKDRDLIDKIYSNPKIGKKRGQYPEGIKQLYKKSGLKIKKILNGTKLTIDETDQIKRYNLSQTDIEIIRSIIKNNKKSKNISLTPKGYQLKFLYPIYIAKRQ